METKQDSNSYPALAVAMTLAAAALWYLCGALVVLGEIPFRQAPGNFFFDMDVGRVIGDWTTFGETNRARVHPLYKFLALPGITINALFYNGEGHARSAQWLCVFGILAQHYVLARLAWVLTGDRLRTVLVTAASAASFSSLLLASIPDAAAASGVWTLVPLLLAHGREGKPISRWEIAAWIVTAVGCYGVTISQLSAFAIALAWRMHGGWTAAAPDARARAVWLPLAAILLGGAATSGVLLRAQSSLFDGTERHYRLDRILRREFKYFETEQLSAAPHARLLREGANVLLYGFACPEPAVETWSPPRDPENPSTSVTIAYTDLRTVTPWQWPLLILHGAAVAWCLWRVRWRERRWWPLLAVLAVQFAMHFVYGREWLIYSPNWHSALVLLLLAAIPAERLPRAKVLIGVGAAWVVLVAANNTWVLVRVAELYRELAPTLTS